MDSRGQQQFIPRPHLMQGGVQIPMTYMPHNAINPYGPPAQMMQDPQQMQQSHQVSPMYAMQNMQNNALMQQKPIQLYRLPDAVADAVDDKTMFVIQASSAGYMAGDFAKILINGEQVYVDKNELGHYRGIHLVVINPFTGKVELARVFDTFHSSEVFERFIRHIVPENCVVVAACKDECVTNLSQAAKQWFANLGSQEIWRLGYRQAFAFIGISGRYDPVENRAIEKQASVAAQQMIQVNIHQAGNAAKSISASLQQQGLKVDPEFLETIITGLGNAISSEETERKEAAEALGEAQKRPGYASALLQISRNRNLELTVEGRSSLDINYAAAIQLGMLVEQHWYDISEEEASQLSGDPEPVVLDKADKQFIRENILQAIFEQVAVVEILSQYTRALSAICSCDYPEKLPNLTNQILQLLNTENQLRVYAGLQALMALCSQYAYEEQENREPLDKIVKETFSVLGRQVKNMVPIKENEDVQRMLNLICQIFLTCNDPEIAPYLMGEQNLDPWILFFKAILDMPVSDEFAGLTEDQAEIQKRNDSIIWEMKGTIAKITYQMFVKYGDPNKVEDKPHIKQFSFKFHLRAISLLESHLTIFLSRTNHFVGFKCLNYVMKFISIATRVNSAREKLMPHVDDNLFDSILSVMVLTENDTQTFEEEPVEFIRGQDDYTQTLFLPRNQVQCLLKFVTGYCSQKKLRDKKTGKVTEPRPDLLERFLHYAALKLKDYTTQVQARQRVDWRIKESLMTAIGTVKDHVVKYADLQQQAEEMLIRYVLPELYAEGSFIRATACSTYEKYGGMEFSDRNHLRQVVMGMLKNIHEAQPLPVKFHAACGLGTLLQSPMASDFIRPGLGEVFKCFLSLMNEYDHEELLTAFEGILAVFWEEIGPYAVDICYHLKAQYGKCINQSSKSDDGLSRVVAVTAFTSMRRVVNVIVISKDVSALMEIQKIMYPCLEHSLSQDGIASLEEGIECINLFLYHGYTDRPLSKEMWALYPYLLWICAGGDDDNDGGYGFEYLNEICEVIKNYISRDVEGMMLQSEGQELTNLQLVNHFITKTLAANRRRKNSDRWTIANEYLDGTAIIGIIVALFENMPGKLDENIPQLVSIILDELTHQLSQNPAPYKALPSMLLQALSMSLTYNSQLVFAWLQQQNLVNQVFEDYFTLIMELDEDFELRRVIFGLAAIIQTEEDVLPVQLGQKLPDIMRQLIVLTKRMYDIRVKRLEENEEMVQKQSQDQKPDEEAGEAESKAEESKMDDGDLQNGNTNKDNVNQNSEAQYEEAPDSDQEEYDRRVKQLEQAKKKLLSGEDIPSAEMRQLVADYTSDEDSEAPYSGRDNPLYCSQIAHIDEIQTVKRSLQQLRNHNPELYNRMMQGVASEDQQKQFDKIMKGIDELIEKEEAVQRLLFYLE